jgi:hypothetical protein
MNVRIYSDFDTHGLRTTLENTSISITFRSSIGTGRPTKRSQKSNVVVDRKHLRHCGVKSALRFILITEQSERTTSAFGPKSQSVTRQWKKRESSCLGSIVTSAALMLRMPVGVELRAVKPLTMDAGCIPRKLMKQVPK